MINFLLGFVIGGVVAFCWFIRTAVRIDKRNALRGWAILDGDRYTIKRDK